jgi:AcrR family transcriptional regulator
MSRISLTTYVVYTSSVVEHKTTIVVFPILLNAGYALIGVTMPISDCQVRDPRIRRTRKLLQGALGALMHSKSFDEISVQDITDAATVNRATFYDHYTDKYALLDAMIAGGFHELLYERQLRYETGCPGALGAIIRATCDFQTQAHSGGECERQTAFEPLMDAAIVAAIRRMLLEGLERKQRPSVVSPEPSAPDPEMIAAAASWAIAGGVKQWLSMPDRPPVETFVPQLLQLVLPMLDAALREDSPIAAGANLHQSSPAPAK